MDQILMGSETGIKTTQFQGCFQDEYFLGAMYKDWRQINGLILERKYQPENEHSDPGNSNDNKQQPDNNPEKGSTSWEGQKRRRTSEATAGGAAAAEETHLENKLIEVLETNSRILSAHLEAQNLNCQLDRDQRKDQTDGLLAVMTKLADALGRIADKL